MGDELIRLREDGTCRVCSAPVAAGTSAWYDAVAGQTTCGGCRAAAHARLPRHARVWPTGATCRETLGEYLDCRAGADAYVLHGRKVPGTRGVIDHIVVAASGVWIIGADDDTGKVEERDYGGWFQSDVRLYVDDRNQTRLVTDVNWQVQTVRQYIARMGFGETPFHRALCFTDATWETTGRPFTIRGVLVAWPEALADEISQDGPVPADLRRALATELGGRVPASSERSGERSLQR